MLDELDQRSRTPPTSSGATAEHGRRRSPTFRTAVGDIRSYRRRADRAITLCATVSRSEAADCRPFAGYRKATPFEHQYRRRLLPPIRLCTQVHHRCRCAGRYQSLAPFQVVAGQQRPQCSRPSQLAHVIGLMLPDVVFGSSPGATRPGLPAEERQLQLDGPASPRSRSGGLTALRRRSGVLRRTVFGAPVAARRPRRRHSQRR